MALKDLFDQAKEHPYTVALALFACIVIGGFAGGAYMTVTEARLGAREERISVMDERLKSQEYATKRQRNVNKLVQEQIGALKKGFDGLPPAVSSVRLVSCL